MRTICLNDVIVVNRAFYHGLASRFGFHRSATPLAAEALRYFLPLSNEPRMPRTNLRPSSEPTVRAAVFATVSSKVSG